jgi:hypothetical protein
MKKTLITLCMTCALALVARAGEGEAPKKEGEHKKPELTAEQKALKKEITEKYDTNKDGKLDKDEKAKISAEDNARMDAAGLTHHKKKEGEKKEGEKK